MNQVLKKIWCSFVVGTGALADLTWPPACEACGNPKVSADGLCAACGVRLLRLVSLTHCPRCGTSIGPNIPVPQDGCAGCPATLPRFERVFRLGPYADPLRSLIHKLKYGRKDTMLNRLGRMLGRAVAARTGDRPLELVMPTAMHWRRRLVRGCDHARSLGATVAKELHLPLGNELVRVRNTPPQVNLPRSRRIENVRGAFAVHRGAGLAGAHILLIDDVTTTGATANEAARTLLRAGAARVVLAVVAKSEPPTAYAQHISN